MADNQKAFFLKFKNTNAYTDDRAYSFLPNDSFSNLNGFTKNFNTNELAIGGTLSVELKLYGTSAVEVVKPWKATDAEKAPLTTNFTRVGYIKNDDLKYVLLTFDLSESFLKNYTQNLVYNDPISRTMLDSLKISVSAGGVNREGYDFLSGDISSDYITANGDEIVGILFTSNENIQQYLADNALKSRIKFLIYNYLPKANEFIPIRVDITIAGELDNKITPKQLGNEFPVNKIDEILQIIELQKKQYSYIEAVAETFENIGKKTTYLNYFKMPITSLNIQFANNDYFEILNAFHSLSFNSLFSYNRTYSAATKSLLEYFKHGTHVFEYKPDLLAKTALPKTIRISNTWQGSLSSISYNGYTEYRQLKELYYEIVGFIKHIAWNFKDENFFDRNKAINRKFYLTKLKNILLNMIFVSPQSNESVTDHYLREDNDVYKLLGNTYNYDTYGTFSTLNSTGIFLHNMFVRTGLFLVDVLWYLNNGDVAKGSENYKFYGYLTNYLSSNSSKEYNALKFPKLHVLNGNELTENFENLFGYLLLSNALIFVFNYLNLDDVLSKNTYMKERYQDFFKATKTIFSEIAKHTSFMNIFDPEKPTTGDEFIFPNNIYSLNSIPLPEIALTLSLLDDTVQYYNSLSDAKYEYVPNYQIWHIIEKDFALNSVQFGENRLIVLNKEQAEVTQSLDFIGTEALLNYGLIDSIITSYGSTISLKTKLITNI